MNKILIIGQALPRVAQERPYDTTMLYKWLAECGIESWQAQHMFQFEAVYGEFTGIDKNGGHLKPTKEQMLEHWVNHLETQVQCADKIWVLGNVAKEFIDKRAKTWACSTEWLYTMHPSTRNYYQYTQVKDDLINRICLFLALPAKTEKLPPVQTSLF